MIAAIAKWFLGWMVGGPHFRIGDPAQPYMLRWYVLPRNKLFNIYLHKILRDDDDRALHDHPWMSVSLLLKGKYTEVTDAGRESYSAPAIRLRYSTFSHRIELHGGTAWTLFFTGPVIRNWGFHCPKGWVRWQDFVDHNDRGNVGKGCGEMG